MEQSDQKPLNEGAAGTAGTGTGAAAPGLSTDQALTDAAAKPAPKISKDGINAKIAGACYSVNGTLTICTLELHNGFKFVGHSACVSPENFDAAIGERLAYDDAFRQIWSHEAYLLAEQLAAEKAAA